MQAPANQSVSVHAGPLLYLKVYRRENRARDDGSHLSEDHTVNCRPHGGTLRHPKRACPWEAAGTAMGTSRRTCHSAWEVLGSRPENQEGPRPDAPNVFAGITSWHPTTPQDVSQQSKHGGDLRELPAAGSLLPQRQRRVSLPTSFLQRVYTRPGGRSLGTAANNPPPRAGCARRVSRMGTALGGLPHTALTALRLRSRPARASGFSHVRPEEEKAEPREPGLSGSALGSPRGCAPPSAAPAPPSVAGRPHTSSGPSRPWC